MIRWLATAGYVGYSPWAPGTAGSLVGIAVCILVRGAPVWVLPSMVVVGTLLGVPVSSRAEALFGTKDAPQIVIDEVVGQMAALLFLPLTPVSLGAGFVLFRLFDIVKPFPARNVERSLPRGAGVMGDDLVAALYANLALQALRLGG